MPHVEKKPPDHFALRTSLLYAAVTILWIVVSDEIVAWLAGDVAQATRLSEVKGIVFVIASALVLYGLLHRVLTKMHHYLDTSGEAAARYRTLFEHSGEAMLVVRAEDGCVLQANEAATVLYGLSRDQLAARRLSDLAATPASEPAAHGAGDVPWHRRAGGEDFPVEISENPLSWDGQPVKMLIVRDISGELARNASLARIAHQDALTGLPNRLMMADLLRIGMARALRTENLLALCFVDLDGFKSVNDRLGHDAGDELLRQVAQRMQNQVRAGDSVIRLGGDEFLLLIGEVNTLGECEAILRRVLNEIGRPVSLRGQEVQVTASIGVAIYPNDADSADTLRTRADEAMYRAKAAGKNRVAFCNPVHERRMRERGELLERVTRAMADDQLTLWYQPVVSARSGRVESVEAMMRWQHPVLGMLPAAEFLPFVGDAEVERDLDLWVLERVRRDWTDWGGLGGHCDLRVNLFANPLHLPRLGERLGALIRTLGERSLTIELVPRASGGAFESLQALSAVSRALGVRLSLDGILAGSDSVQALISSPMDEVKFAPALVGLDARGEGDEDLAAAYIRVGACLGHGIVAKEVDGSAQLQRLLDLGCPHVQGRAVCAPVPAGAVPELIWRQFKWTRTEASQ
jgi:diguanylate cyclase (GGDEF)-like protein/PAS domain S-box-containing protein